MTKITPRTVVRVGTLLWVLSGAASCDSTPAETPTCKSLQAQASAQAAAADEDMTRLRTAIAAAMKQPPEVGENACGVTGLNPRQHKVVPAGGAASMPEPGPLGALRSFDLPAKDCRFLDPATQKKRLDELKEAVASHGSAHSIIFAEGERRKPKLIDAKTYEPGTLTGRVFLWSHGEGRIVCSADAQATSGARLTTIRTGPGSTARSLNNQLTFLAVKDGVEKLRKVKK